MDEQIKTILNAAMVNGYFVDENGVVVEIEPEVVEKLKLILQFTVVNAV